MCVLCPQTVPSSPFSLPPSLILSTNPVRSLLGDFFSSILPSKITPRTLKMTWIYTYQVEPASAQYFYTHYTFVNITTLVLLLHASEVPARLVLFHKSEWK